MLKSPSSQLTEPQAEVLRRIDHNLNVGYDTQRHLVESFGTGEMADLMREIRSLDEDTMRWTMVYLVGMQAMSHV